MSVKLPSASTVWREVVVDSCGSIGRRAVGVVMSRARFAAARWAHRSAYHEGSFATPDAH